MQAQSWIPVSERLPGKKYWGKKILVIIDNQPSCQSYYGRRIGMTHWMQIILPEQLQAENKKLIAGQVAKKEAGS